MQNIALNIVLNGVPQAISNLTQFEEVLNAARAQLQSIEIGSEAFKKLSAEIKTADNSLRQLKKETEGKDLEGRLGDFGKLGGAIGSSFAAATAAIQLFGDGSEESLKSVTAAQNALTIALAARGVAEGLVVVKTVANDIATKALAASTTATNTVTKAFYTTLAANPYAAILTAVGLLVGIFSQFTSETEDATKAQKEFQDSLNKDIAKEVTNLTVLANRIKNVNLSLETRKEAIKQLREIAPNYFKDLSDEEILQKNLKNSIDDVTEALIKQSTAKALQTRVEETATKILAARDAVTAAVKEETRARENLLRVQQQAERGAFGQGTGVALSTAANASRVATENVAKATKNLNDLNAKRRADLQEIQNIETEVDKILGGQVEEEKKITTEKDKQVITNTELINQERQRLSLTEQLNALIFDPKAEPVILERQKKILESLTELSDKLGMDGPKIVKALKDIFNPPQPEPTSDPFKQIIDNTPTILRALTKIPVAFNEIEEVAKKLGIEIKGTFSEEQKNDIQKFFNALKTAPQLLFDIVSKLPEASKVSKEQIQELFTSLLSQQDELRKKAKEGNIQAEQQLLNFDKQIEKSVLKIFAIDEKLAQGVEFSKEGLTKLFEAENKSKEEAEKLADTILRLVESLVTFAQGTDEVALKVVDNNQKIAKSFEEVKKRIGELSDEDVGKFLQQFGLDFQKGLTFLVTNAGELGADVTKQLLEGLATLDPKLQELTLKQVKQLKETLKIAGLELEQYGIDIETVFAGVFDKIDQDIKNKLVTGIVTAIEQIQMVLNSLSQTTSLYFQSQFDKLEKRYKRVQDSIVGDTEEANKKRIEAEKIYQDEKIKLEKQAAKTALRISLAQAVANTAEAITKLAAITGGVGAVVAGGLVAALNAVQVGIIANQLASIDEYRKGGIIKKQGGGYITGPSHEMGGVKYQGGGIELEGREAVINRTSTVNYMGLLDQINQAGGGSPIYPNFDDSRIVEAIAKQRNTPIRAYVVESDITERQNTTRRLEQLAKI